ncbi:MAG: hypothetical protein FJ291_06670 [Planctomycetes bacterium]|nr:hypothetical protein [Planctomycetota bacterium]
MTLEEVRGTLDAEWLGRRPSRTDSIGAEVLSCHASDLMSDVLTSRGAGSLLLTGLTNEQVVRVAVVSDFAAVCFVRGKRPQPEAARLAEESQVPLLVTPLSMYESCGRLYTKGLPVGDKAKEAASCRKK